MERGEGGRVRRDLSKLPLQIASAVCLASFTTQTTPVGSASCLRQKVPSSPALGVRGGVQAALGRMHLTGKGRGPPTPLRSQLLSLPRTPARLPRDALDDRRQGEGHVRVTGSPYPRAYGIGKVCQPEGLPQGGGWALHRHTGDPEGVSLSVKPWLVANGRKPSSARLS